MIKPTDLVRSEKFKGVGMVVAAPSRWKQTKFYGTFFATNKKPFISIPVKVLCQDGTLLACELESLKKIRLRG